MADLLEVERSPLDGPLRLDGNEIATVLARFDMPPVANNSDASLAPHAEPAQPLYARYWLHTRGPAPLGGLPAVAHLHPHDLAADAGADVTLRLTVASDRTDAPLRGRVELILPPRWSSECAFGSVDVAPGGHDEAAVSVSVPADTRPGLYPVRAQLSLRDVPTAWEQVVEDVCLVAVGDPLDSEVIRIHGPAAVEVAPGDTARLVVTVGTDVRAELPVEAHLISPWGTWEWIGPASAGAVVPASGTVDLAFNVTPPPGLPPGRWWALVRVGCAGHLRYSEAVEVTVR